MTAGSGRTTQHNAQHPAPAWFADAVALVERQETLLARLDALSQRQSDLIASGEADVLLSVLTERQPVVEELVAATESIAAARAAWDGLPASDPWRAGISERMRRAADLAASIAARDREDETAMRRASELIAAELGTMGRQRSAAAAYATPAPMNRPRLQDREG